jgi:hypothetical protein
VTGAWQLWARPRRTFLGITVAPWHLVEGFVREVNQPVVLTACERQLDGSGIRISDQRPTGRFTSRPCLACLRVVGELPIDEREPLPATVPVRDV